MVDGGGEEMCRAHGQVSDTEVEERLRGGGLIARVEQFLDPGEMVVKCRIEGAFEKVFDDEVWGEVGAGRFALTGVGVEVDPAGGHDNVVAVACGGIDLEGL